MELKLIRTARTDQSTIGDLFVVEATGDEYVCKILEDKDRGLTQRMDPVEIGKKKVYGRTAIPTGRYTVAITMSQRFARLLPLLLSVPGFEGIRIHPGNTPADTDGCLLPGLSKSVDFVGSSRAAFDVVYKLIQDAINRGEQVFITIE